MITLFNRALLALAPSFEARADAPGTFAELATCAGRDILPVWEGASDRTIYGDALVNWAFRAHHDMHHLAGGFPFTAEGEAATCEAQILDLYRSFPSAPAWCAALLRAEVNGQFQFAAQCGDFPDDQAGFIRTLIAV